MLKKILFSLFLSSALLMVGMVAAQTDTQTVTVTARYLNVRQGPSTSTTIMAVVSAGEVFPVLGQSGSWWQIQVRDVVGFVSGRYVRVSGGTPATLMPNPGPDLATPTPCALTTLFWGQDTGGVCVDPAHTTKAAFQQYQHGFMVWLADSGDIWVFIDAASYPHAWIHLGQKDYENLPDAAGPAPSGLTQPINGFGKVWANTLDVTGGKLSDRLGWAAANEVSYTATWQFYGAANLVNTYITVPTGKIVTASMNLVQIIWMMSE